MTQGYLSKGKGECQGPDQGEAQEASAAAGGRGGRATIHGAELRGGRNVQGPLDVLRRPWPNGPRTSCEDIAKFKKPPTGRTQA